MDPVKLQAQLVKLQSQCDETAKERDALQKVVDRLKDQNRRGDAELRKAEGASLLSLPLAFERCCAAFSAHFLPGREQPAP